ncbi:PaaI family thioesterase [Nocardioides sp. SYSU DS0651]|uniref:PaaI family thioesterase n=1 Tax=Nocardioides sp. SYSU DS0651 TaxID=3415955 RepID=UPI003F4BE9CF
MKAFPPFPPDDTPGEEIEREAALWRPFAQAVRDLVDASVRTAVGEDEIRAAQAEIEDVVARLRKEQLPATLGVLHRPNGRRRPWGNPVIGVRNPIAPPLVVRSSPEGRAESDFHCGAAYEGPPGLVHGGVVSLVLDQMLGQAVGAGGRPGMTGTLTIVYRRGTPLGDLRAEAWIDRYDEVKTWAKGHLIGPDGVTAEAEGVFILPRQVREQLAAAQRGEDVPPVPGLRIFE